MDTKDFKETMYTIQMDSESGTVWLNNHISKEKFILTEKDSNSIANCFKLINARKRARKQGLI
jgi:hypothetical protein